MGWRLRLRLRRGARRLSASALAACVLGLTLWFAIDVLRETGIRTATLRRRAEELVARGELTAACRLLEQCFPRFRGDPDFLHLYALSSCSAPGAGKSSLHGALTILEEALRLEPGHLPSLRLALAIRLELRRDSEAVSTAWRVLLERPDDADTLGTLALLQARNGRVGQTDRTPGKLLLRAPGASRDDLVGALLLRDLGRPFESGVWREEPAGFSARIADDLDTRRTDLRRTPENLDVPPIVPGVASLERYVALSPSRTLALHDWMVDTGDFEGARDLLGRALRQMPEPDECLTRTYLWRLWEIGSLDRLLDTARSLELPASGDMESSALVALASCTRGNRGAAQNALAATERHRGSAEAEAWSLIVDARSRGERPEIARLRRALHTATGSRPDRPLLWSLLGKVKAGDGDWNGAIGAWLRAIALAPAWAGPHADLALGLARVGQVDMARDAARAAVLRTPPESGQSAWAVLTSFLVAETAAHWESQAADSGGAATRLRELIGVCRNLRPRDEPVLLLEIGWLVRDRRTSMARSAVLDALRGPTVLRQETLFLLAELSELGRLGLGERCLETTERWYGHTAGLLRYRSRPHDEAMAASTLRPTAGAGCALLARDHVHDDPVWDLARAGRLEEWGDRDAAAVWMAVGDHWAGSLRVQRAVLRAAARLGDDSLVDRCLERVGRINGGEAFPERLVRARRAIEARDPGQGLVKATAALRRCARDAPWSPEVRRLLETALTRLRKGSSPDSGPARILEHPFEAAPVVAPRARSNRCVPSKRRPVDVAGLLGGIIDECYRDHPLDGLISQEQTPAAQALVARLRDDFPDRPVRDLREWLATLREDLRKRIRETLVPPARPGAGLTTSSAWPPGGTDRAVGRMIAGFDTRPRSIPDSTF